MQQNIDNQTKVTFSQTTFFFLFGCRSGAWARLVAAGHTLKQLSPETLQFPSLKPNLIIIQTTVTFVLRVRMRRGAASHTNKAVIAHCRAGGRASERLRSPPSCFFAHVVQDDAENHNLKPLECRDELTARFSSGHIVHTSSKIISMMFTGRGLHPTPSLQQ